MRVLFTTYADKTHFLPMVPLAWALRTAGHEVVVATQPALVDGVVETGLTAVSVGRDHQLWRVLGRRSDQLAAATGDRPAPPYDAPELPRDEVTLESLVQGYRTAVPWWHRLLNDPMISDVVAFAQRWQPDLVVWETNTFGGPIAAKVVGCAHARLMWSIDYFGRTRELFRELAGQVDAVPDPLADWLDSRLAKYGLGFGEDVITGDFTIDHLPDSLRMGTGLDLVPMRYVAYNGRSAEPDWLREPAALPRVGVTLGVSWARDFGGLAFDVEGLLREVASLGVEVVATLPDSARAQLGRLPETVRVVGFTPLHALVPTCTAMVHHGGPGTICTTALSGVPQLALPRVYDEPYLAARLAEHGAGLALPGSEATGAGVRDGVLRLLTEPAFTRRAGDLRAELLAMPTPNELVPRLETLSSRGAAPAR